jgi:hypothetical protein
MGQGGVERSGNESAGDGRHNIGSLTDWVIGLLSCSRFPCRKSAEPAMDG